MRKPLAKLSKAVLMTAAALITCAPPAKAVTYYWWDANASPNGLGNSSSSSTDNWTSAYWYNGSTTFSAPTGNSATGSLPSSASNLVVFSGTEGTVSLTSAFNVAGIIARSSETIQNSAALTVGSSGIAVASGKTLTITGSLSGNFSLLRNSASTDGGGTLVLSGSRGTTYTTTVDTGVLRLASEAPLGTVNRSVTYQDACHLVHGQKIKAQPRELLHMIPGVDLIEMKDPDRCCGSAGIYNILQPDMSSQVLDAKLENVVATKASCIVASNPGCLLQINMGLRDRGMDMTGMHIIDILDESITAARIADPVHA